MHHPKVVAEISGNHGGKLENCLRLIDQAKILQVDSIKFQCFDPNRLARKRAAGQLGDRYDEKTLRAIYKKTYTPMAWWEKILKRLDGYPWSCSVFSIEDLALMEAFDCPSYKIASFEAQELGLIRDVASTKKPIVISVNDSLNDEDVNNAYDAAKGSRHITFLYATPYDNSDVLEDYERVVWLAQAAPIWLDIGLSDHSASGETALIEKCAEDWLIGMVERHLRLPEIDTPDLAFSDTVEQFANYMKVIQDVTAFTHRKAGIFP